jgi:3-oxoacyl-[acyl-carrier protein] reductase
VNNNDRIALVTGAAGSLGKAIALKLSEDGFVVVMTDCDESVIVSAKDITRRGFSAKAKICNLLDALEIKNLIDSIASEYGRCDVLVNNAGVHPLQPTDNATALENTTLADWQQAIAVNLTAPFLLAKAVFPLMKAKRWGRIINTASRAGRTSIPGTAAHYSTTKSGIIGLTRSLAEQGAAFGITSNAVAPGRFPSPLADTMPPDEVAASLKRIPLGRIGSPHELASTVAFLASEGAAYTTGSVIDVNGGAFMG